MLSVAVNGVEVSHTIRLVLSGTEHSITEPGDWFFVYPRYFYHPKSLSSALVVQHYITI